MPGQRWFTVKGIGEPSMNLAEVITLSDDGQVAVLLCFITVAVKAAPGRRTAPEVTYQVPITVHRRVRQDPLGQRTLIGPVDDGWAYDGPHDPHFARSWLSLLAGRRVLGDLHWTLADGISVDPDAPVVVLSGEQSNTSLIIDPEGPTPMIAKLFRGVQPGANPDVDITAVLSEAGYAQVPALLGWVSGTGPVAIGHLAAISEYLPGSVDAWRLACEALETGVPFAPTARAVGVATAQVHQGLLTTCGRVELEPEPLVASLVERLQWAVDAVPELAEHAGAARRLFESVATRPLPAQRIHGDLHLGQVLDAGTRGWVLLDFEGEPLRPLADRCRPDLVLRDIAGMLRSFDYAAGHAALGLTGDDPARAKADRWAAECREAFLAGYEAAYPVGSEPFDTRLLAALELDKALYEVVYEARNRPTWLEIPLRAVQRLVTRS